MATALRGGWRTPNVKTNSMNVDESFLQRAQVLVENELEVFRKNPDYLSVTSGPLELVEPQVASYDVTVEWKPPIGFVTLRRCISMLSIKKV